MQSELKSRTTTASEVNYYADKLVFGENKLRMLVPSKIFAKPLSKL